MIQLLALLHPASDLAAQAWLWTWWWLTFACMIIGLIGWAQQRQAANESQRRGQWWHAWERGLSWLFAAFATLAAVLWMAITLCLLTTP